MFVTSFAASLPEEREITSYPASSAAFLKASSRVEKNWFVLSDNIRPSVRSCFSSAKTATGVTVPSTIAAVNAPAISFFIFLSSHDIIYFIQLLLHKYGFI